MDPLVYIMLKYATRFKSETWKFLIFAKKVLLLFDPNSGQVSRIETIICITLEQGIEIIGSKSYTRY